MIVAIFVYLLAIACWLGAIVFFSFVTAPSVFTSLPIAEAGKVISVIFPRYYAVGYIAGSVAVLMSILFTVARPARGWWGITTVLLALGLAITFYAGLVVLPRADKLRHVAEDSSPQPEQKAEFDRLHALSVYLNGAVLLLNVGALVTTAGALTGRG